MNKNHKQTNSTIIPKKSVVSKNAFPSAHKTPKEAKGNLDHKKTKEFSLNDSSKKDLNKSKIVEPKHESKKEAPAQSSSSTIIKPSQPSTSTSSSSSISASDFKKLENEKKELARQLAEIKRENVEYKNKLAERGIKVEGSSLEEVVKQL